MWMYPTQAHEIGKTLTTRNDKRKEKHLLIEASLSLHVLSCSRTIGQSRQWKTFWLLSGFQGQQDCLGCITLPHTLRLIDIQ